MTTSSTASSPAPRPTALVTGASSGVGHALTLRLLREGWRVLALQRSAIPLEDPWLKAAADDGRLVWRSVDLAVPSRLLATLSEIAAAEPRIDLLVNNAGVSLEAAAAAPSGRDLHFEVNVLAPYLVTRALLPQVAASTHRTVVQVSSNALLSAKPLSRDELLRPTRFRKLLGPYASSKLALSLWTHALAPSLPVGVTMLSVCPGGNDTPMTRSGGMPALLRVLVPFFFAAPSQGADRLLAASIGREPPHPSGSFIHRGKPTRLPYEERAAEVLSWVEDEARAG